MSDTAIRLRDALSGRYRLERELGAGGMATVYLAHGAQSAVVAVLDRFGELTRKVGR